MARGAAAPAMASNSVASVARARRAPDAAPLWPFIFRSATTPDFGTLDAFTRALTHPPIPRPETRVRAALLRTPLGQPDRIEGTKVTTCRVCPLDSATHLRLSLCPLFYRRDYQPASASAGSRRRAACAATSHGARVRSFESSHGRPHARDVVRRCRAPMSCADVVRRCRAPMSCADVVRRCRATMSCDDVVRRCRATVRDALRTQRHARAHVCAASHAGAARRTMTIMS